MECQNKVGVLLLNGRFPLFPPLAAPKVPDVISAVFGGVGSAAPANNGSATQYPVTVSLAVVLTVTLVEEIFLSVIGVKVNAAVTGITVKTKWVSICCSLSMCATT